MKRREGQHSSATNEIRGYLAEKGLAPNKRFGQNFLTDEGVLDAIVEAAELSEKSVVLEIGPGTGQLTTRLADTGARVVAVEIDRGLAATLSERFADEKNVTIHCEDILKADLAKLLEPALSEAEDPAGDIRVVANLPYYITTPILMALLPRDELFSCFVVMLQKEVADRMQARPGSKDYGALSLAVQYYVEPSLVTEVSPDAFYPQPEVRSAVLKLVRHEKPPVTVSDPERMFALIRAAFGKRRKTLVNAAAGSPGVGADAAQLRAALMAAGLDENVRGEVLSLKEFAAIIDAML